MKERFFATEAQNDRSREPTPDKVGGDEFVILSETKDLDGGKMKERFFAEDAQNDTHPVVIPNEVKDLGGGRAKERFFAEEAQNDKMKERFFAEDAQHDRMKERFFAKDAQNDRMKERFFATNAQNDRMKERFFAEDAQHDRMKERFFAKDAQNDKMKVRFFAKDAQNDRKRRTTPSLRDAPLPTATLVGSSTKEGVKGAGDEFVILSETKDLDGGKTEERFFAKEAQNDRIAGKHGGLPLPLLLCLMLLSVLVSPVVAQEPTTRVFLNPTPLQIDTTISPTGVVSLEVADGVDIFAFDLFVQYDPALLTVSQVTLGGFLGEGLCCMDQVNNPGLVHYNCTRFGVSSGVSGSGVLLELTFEASGQAGDTALLLNGSALYDWPDACLVEATLEDGVVSVRPYRTFLPLIMAAGGQGMGAVR